MRCIRHDALHPTRCVASVAMRCMGRDALHATRCVGSVAMRCIRHDALHPTRCMAWVVMRCTGRDALTRRILRPPVWSVNRDPKIYDHTGRKFRPHYAKLIATWISSSTCEMGRAEVAGLRGRVAVTFSCDVCRSFDVGARFEIFRFFTFLKFSHVFRIS